ncbi:MULTISPECIES: hypothetical protein [Halolamina]|uniref:Uncharacterized protein n=1 Tax=Halolamina pelagica TaxID=699431 RepID=A0A1I5RRR4_9EURY|nr:MULTISPECIES: hypothetical protein [Halolamina]NHX35313.1 hypothetical protein [Halolamina sp. R1-12]SFP61234.1 hypothetical protein SAMN05216277_105109 [Halolamina pelagica]
MSESPGTEDDTTRSYRLDRLAGFSVIGAFAFSLALLFVGEPLFWVPFAVGLGIGLPGFAILADRERDRTDGSGPATAGGEESAESDEGSA